MRVILARTHVHGPATFGRWLVDGAFVCYTLEDEIRERADIAVATWKIKGATTIPSTAYVGKPYRLTLEHSPRFGPGTMTVNDVPGFTGVRMHAGNTPDDSEGCPLLGFKVNATGIVAGTSKLAVSKVKELLRAQ